MVNSLCTHLSVFWFLFLNFSFTTPQINIKMMLTWGHTELTTPFHTLSCSSISGVMPHEHHGIPNNQLFSNQMCVYNKMLISGKTVTFGCIWKFSNCCLLIIRSIRTNCSYAEALRQKQKSRHLAYEIFELLFLYETYSEMFPIENRSALAKIMAYRRLSNKSLPESIMASMTYTIQTNLRINVLNKGCCNRPQ